MLMQGFRLFHLFRLTYSRASESMDHITSTHVPLPNSVTWSHLIIRLGNEAFFFKENEIARAYFWYQVTCPWHIINGL